jgi:transcriptional regulator with XRE-family HTH domain
MITMWLDYRRLDGPEVDAACGVAEPTVDLWEAGRVYPTWEQLTALAKLCQVAVWKFTEDPLIEPGAVFICGGRRNAAARRPSVLAFDPLAIAAAGIDPYPTTLATPDEHGQGRLI